jgi:hypothetical protein
MHSCKISEGTFIMQRNITYCCYDTCTSTFAYFGTMKSRERPPPYPGLCCLEDLPQPVQVQVHLGRRKIRLIECNAKCRYIKKWPVKGLCGRCFYLSEAPSPPMTSYPPPLHTVLYTAYVLIHIGKWESLPEKRLEG